MSEHGTKMSGTPAVDIPRAMYLVELARYVPFCSENRGQFIVKVFQEMALIGTWEQIRSLFTKVKIRKPDASRARSREVYIVCDRGKL